METSTAEIERVGEDVRAGKFPFWFMDKYYPFEGQFPREIPPFLAAMGLSFDRPQELANVVHMDSPQDMPKAYLKWLTHPMYEQNQNVYDHTDQYVNFLETVPRAELNIAKGVYKYMQVGFDIKHFYGLARPEEEDPTIKTFYPEGCPCHPDFIQGHVSAALGGLGAVFKDFPNRTYQQTKDGLDGGYSWAMFRSFAEVHHAIAAIGGFAMHPTFRKYMKRKVLKKYRLTIAEKKAYKAMYPWL